MVMLKYSIRPFEAPKQVYMLGIKPKVRIQKIFLHCVNISFDVVVNLGSVQPLKAI